ncbi:MAG TPA: alpha-ketoglutarate-dependent dioxygenase AlkB [Candidatus Baltobacteraceae bacterium]|nr:alpha-ketoglutarate-dependent dioxygenase AlkB [Candidatus Baltobacteraceae bacterium]
MLNPSLFEASVTGAVCAHEHAVRIFGDDDLLYFRHFYSEKASLKMLDALLTSVPWKQELLKIYGRSVPTPRLTAWYGDPGAAYTYSGLRNEPNPWTPLLLEMVDELYSFVGVRFNSVLLNRYRNGDDSLSWHADDEPELGAEPTIASLSLGTPRLFKLRKTSDPKDEASLRLESGSLLLMQGRSQAKYRHSVPKERKVRGERINLTFRVVATGGTASAPIP